MAEVAAHLEDTLSQVREAADDLSAIHEESRGLGWGKLALLPAGCLFTVELPNRSIEVLGHTFPLYLDSGNSAFVIGFLCRDQFWGLKKTLSKGISEPQ